MGIKDYLKIIELYPENINAYHNIALIKYYHRDFSGVIETYAYIIEIEANNDEAYVSRGKIKEDIIIN